MSTDFKCKNTSDDVFGEKFALGEATKDSEPLKSSFFICVFSRFVFTPRVCFSRFYVVVRVVVVLLLFFSRRLNVTCAGAERKKYISATNSLLIATAQFLDALALRYARVFIERISFVVLVVVTEESAEALNYSSTQIAHKIAGAERRFKGETKCISKPHKLHAREAQQKNTTAKELPPAIIF